jgi:hypothetical protein
MRIPALQTGAAKQLATFALSALLATAPLAPQSALPAFASRTIGEVQTSGLVFKDTLKVEAFEDPKVTPGVPLERSCVLQAACGCQRSLPAPTRFAHPQTSRVVRGWFPQTLIFCRRLYRRPYLSTARFPQ